MTEIDPGKGKSGRRFLLAGGLVVLATIAVFALRTGKAPIRYVTTPIERGRVTARVTATGTLSARVTVQVGSQVSGRIQEIRVDYNSPVTKGQLLAKIDPQLFVAAVEQAKANHLASIANLAKAKVQAEDAKRQYDRATALLDRKLVAQADVDTLKANADIAASQVVAAEGSVEQNRAALHLAEVNLTYTSILSPITGVVISRNVDVGQTVAASLQTPTLFTIAEDLRKMQVHTNVAEADVGKIQTGEQISFRVDAYPGDPFEGTISQIRNAAQTVQNVVTYDAVIDVDNSELKLRPGMTATVTFAYADKAGVLKVPNAAFRFRPPPEILAGMAKAGSGPPSGTDQAGPHRPAAKVPSEGRTLWVLKEQTPMSVLVRAGISDGSWTEVEGEGLSEGDRVITDVEGSSSPRGQVQMRRLF